MSATDPYFTDDKATLYAGDCRDILESLAPASVDAICTDPPYELNFMGRAWDASGVAYDVDMWRECLRVLKPGGHLIAFGGTRTYHRMTCAIEDAGFEIRDSLHWIYGSGFPKSLDVSKAIDKAAGATREVVATIPDRWTGKGTALNFSTDRPQDTVTVTGAPATPDAVRWQGWGTALKPAHEPIVLARKPLGGTVAASVLAHGTGALNVDACRIGTRLSEDDGARGRRPRGMGEVGERKGDPRPNGPTYAAGDGGRWPTNVVLTHQPLLDDTGNIIGDACADGCVRGCPIADMDAQSGTTKTGASPLRRLPALGVMNDDGWQPKATAGVRYTGERGASRFFPVFRYEAKAPSSERPRGEDGAAHATVKPLALMRWLVRLATQPGGVVLDPFLGSGTTAEACVIEGFRCIGIERDETHLPLIKARLAKPIQPTLGFEDAS
jgi:site-specific DNA-methyltransferase (adenine-specific)